MAECSLCRMYSYCPVVQSIILYDMIILFILWCAHSSSFFNFISVWCSYSVLFILLLFCTLKIITDWQYIGMHSCIRERNNAHRYQYIHCEFSHCRPTRNHIMLTTDCGMGRYWDVVSGRIDVQRNFILAGKLYPVQLIHTHTYIHTNAHIWNRSELEIRIIIFYEYMRVNVEKYVEYTEGLQHINLFMLTYTTRILLCYLFSPFSRKYA